MTESGNHVPPRNHGARLAYVPALDGLRAVAVTMVIAYHLDFQILPGGFMGVDLFFVLSGFLITSLLLREHATDGRIGLVAFWLRRARRLLPALFLFLGTVAVWAVNASPFERAGLRGDLLSALVYVTNWRFIAEGESYFQEFASPSPLQHLWSLAIEEQFYLVWPLLIAAALGIRLIRSGRTPMLVVALLVASVASAVALASTFDEYDPSVAYFATHTRAHELLVGALAAVLADRSSLVRRLAGRFAMPMAAVAGLVLVGFFVLLRDSSPAYFIGGSVVFSVAAAVLVVSLTAGATSRRHLVERALALRPIAWVGVISYGLYLWHWPMILWLTPSVGIDGPLLDVVRVGATFAISTASFFLLERPIRRGAIGRLRLGVPQVAAGTLACVLAIGALSVYTTRGAQELPEFVSNNRQLIVTAVPDADGSVGLVGDSIAMSLYPGLAYEAARASLQLVAATFPGCPIGEVERVDRDGAPFPFARRCPDIAPREQTELVEGHDPEVIFWVSARERFTIRVGEEIIRPGTSRWEEVAFADWDRALDRLTAGGAQVVLILPFHGTGQDPTACAGEEALDDERCTRPNLSTNALRTEYVRWAAGHPERVTILDPDPALCPADPCPAQVGGVTLRSDSVHFTSEGARLAARRLLRALPDELRGKVQARP